MFNELKRYFYYRKQYKFDSLCDAIYTLIFIVGIIMIFSGQTLLNILYFYIYFLVTNITLLANEELEYEIRTSQYDNLITSKYKVKRIYLRRIVAYLVWSSILFIISLFVSKVFGSSTHFVFPKMSIFGAIVFVSINLVLFLVFYMGVIKLTEKFKRVSVLLNFLNTIFLFYSGLVFPTSFETFADMLNKILSLGNN